MIIVKHDDHLDSAVVTFNDGTTRKIPFLKEFDWFGFYGDENEFIEFITSCERVFIRKSDVSQIEFAYQEEVNHG